MVDFLFTLRRLHKAKIREPETDDELMSQCVYKYSAKIHHLPLGVS